MRNINEQISISAKATIRVYDKNIDISEAIIETDYHFGDGLNLKVDNNSKVTIEKCIDLCGNKLDVTLGQVSQQKKLGKDLKNDKKLIDGFKLGTDIMGLRFEFLHGKQNHSGAHINIASTDDETTTRSAYSLSGDFESCGRDLKWCIQYNDFEDALDLGLESAVEEIDGAVSVIVPLNNSRKPKYAVRSKMVEGYDVELEYNDQQSEHKFSADVCTEICGTEVTFKYQDSATQSERFNIKLDY